MTTNPIATRDLLLGEPNGFVRESTIRQLVAEGWPTEAILAEFPNVSEAEIRRHQRAEQFATA